MNARAQDQCVYCAGKCQPGMQLCRVCMQLCRVSLQEVDIAMLAAMATFGFAHNSLTYQAEQQHTPLHTAGIATQAELQQSGTSAAAARFSRSLLATPSDTSPVHTASQSASMQLGGPVAAAELPGGQKLQAPVPGRDKVRHRAGNGAHQHQPQHHTRCLSAGRKGTTSAASGAQRVLHS